MGEPTGDVAEAIGFLVSDFRFWGAVAGGLFAAGTLVLFGVDPWTASLISFSAMMLTYQGMLLIAALKIANRIVIEEEGS